MTSSLVCMFVEIWQSTVCKNNNFTYNEFWVIPLWSSFLQYFLLMWNRTSKFQVKLWQFAALVSLSIAIWPWTLLFGIYLYFRPVLLGTQVSTIGPSWSSFTNLWFRKRGVNDKLIHKLHKCWIFLDVTFLKRSPWLPWQIKFGRWDKTQVACFTPPSSPVTNHFPSAFTFLKRDLFREQNPSTTALVFNRREWPKTRWMFYTGI